MAIKSLDELRKLRASLQDKVNLREKGEVEDSKLVEVLVGMGTCGIAAGARDTFNKLLEVIEELKLGEVKVISVGCIGFCHAEPTIQINIPGQEPVIYGKITEGKVKELVDTVIIKRELLDENYLIKSFNKAVV
ncbi:NADP-reducing hydrogenase subunit HndB [Candidatus Izimaplasma bacterium HR1]|jgi:NADP-reducing hydrogenase subunit HndB|uniref:(2Fe-2S) ferredoxin domain-containing protein n=1 Tax=Candidatus Izimoplasma sp. HR1 TaxID=1541959 RepID=UPI0004F85404|nr:NADP-reducing hydrogenase subunit HndB [Candidatus Izimaplasma bacterium HR1]